MVSGLIKIGEIPARDLKTEFTTYVDPYIEEAFRYTFEPHQFDLFKNWSRSFYTIEAHVASILKFDKELANAPNDEVWHSIVRETFQEFESFDKVTSLSAKDDFDKVRFHQSTSAGYGYFDRESDKPAHKGLPNGPNHKRAKRIASKICVELQQHISDGTLDGFLESVPMDSTPDIAFTRTQLVELPLTKVRNVFGECFHYVILEGLFAQPLINWFMHNDTFYYIGAEPLEGVPKLIQEMTSDQTKFVTIDWSGFDASVQPYEIDLAFDLMKTMLVFPDEVTEAVFSYVKTLFLSRKLAGPNGDLFLRTGGIPSGSYFTHIVDSIINYVRIKYLFRLNGITWNKIRTHGDDALAQVSERAESLLPLVEQGESLGWMINPLKSQLTQNPSNVEFLGRSSMHGVNYRVRDKCLRLCLYTEYPVSDPQISIARLKAIYFDSGVYVTEMIKAYHYLNRKYGDRNVDLPRLFKTFTLRDYYRPVGI